MPLLLVWVPPPPQVTLQGDHVLQVSQIQSKGFASEIKKTMARLKLVTIMRISEIQSKGLHTAYLDHNNLIISSLTITPNPCLTRIRLTQTSLTQIFNFSFNMYYKTCIR